MSDMIAAGVALMKIAGYGDPAHWSWWAIAAGYLTYKGMLIALDLIIAQGLSK